MDSSYCFSLVSSGAPNLPNSSAPSPDNNAIASSSSSLSAISSSRERDRDVSSVGSSTSTRSELKQAKRERRRKARDVQEGTEVFTGNNLGGSFEDEGMTEIVVVPSKQLPSVKTVRGFAWASPMLSSSTTPPNTSNSTTITARHSSPEANLRRGKRDLMKTWLATPLSQGVESSGDVGGSQEMPNAPPSATLATTLPITSLLALFPPPQSEVTRDTTLTTKQRNVHDDTASSLHQHHNATSISTTDYSPDMTTDRPTPPTTSNNSSSCVSGSNSSAHRHHNLVHVVDFTLPEPEAFRNDSSIISHQPSTQGSSSSAVSDCPFKTTSQPPPRCSQHRDTVRAISSHRSSIVLLPPPSLSLAVFSQLDDVEGVDDESTVAISTPTTREEAVSITHPSPHQSITFSHDHHHHHQHLFGHFSSPDTSVNGIHLGETDADEQYFGPSKDVECSRLSRSQYVSYNGTIINNTNAHPPSTVSPSGSLRLQPSTKGAVYFNMDVYNLDTWDSEVMGPFAVDDSVGLVDDVSAATITTKQTAPTPGSSTRQSTVPPSHLHRSSISPGESFQSSLSVLAAYFEEGRRMSTSISVNDDVSPPPSGYMPVGALRRPRSPVTRSYSLPYGQLGLNHSSSAFSMTSSYSMLRRGGNSNSSALPDHKCRAYLHQLGASYTASCTPSILVSRSTTMQPRTGSSILLATSHAYPSTKYSFSEIIGRYVTIDTLVHTATSYTEQLANPVSGAGHKKFRREHDRWQSVLEE